MEPEPVRIETFGLTDQGKVRRRNEDHFLIADLTKSLRVRQTSLEHQSATTYSDLHGHVLLVADGMGGHAAGQEAAAIAVETIESYLVRTMPWFLSLRPDVDHSTDDELKAALSACHDAVLAAGRDRPEHEGMGTTMTVAYVVWPWLYLVHVGDSRCYLLRGRQLERVTRDHTYAQKLVEEGGLTPHQAEGSFLSNVLTRVVGGDKEALEVDVHKVRLAAGDLLLLTTDGLTKHLKDDEIHDLLRSGTAPEELGRRLVTEALERGGTDNVTVALASFHRPDDGAR